MYRVVSGEGKAVTLDGESTYSVVDTDVEEGWYEVDAPEEEHSIDEFEII